MDKLTSNEIALVLEGLDLLRLETGRKRHLLGTYGCAEALAKVDELVSKIQAIKAEAQLQAEVTRKV